MGKVTEEFKKSVENLKEFVVLATVDARRYQKTNMDIIKHLTEDRTIPGVYVTLNKPFRTLQNTFKRNKIDTDLILFIDAVTQTAGGEAEKTDQCLFIGSPDNLSDISIAMDQAVRALPSKDKFVFFDSLSTLLIYNNVETVARFIHFLAGKMRVWKVMGVIISLRKKHDQELIDELMQFCDVVLDF